jgi:hypothetical protein
MEKIDETILPVLAKTKAEPIPNIRSRKDKKCWLQAKLKNKDGYGIESKSRLLMKSHLPAIRCLCFSRGG